MVGPATFLAFFVAGPARPPQTCHASRDTSRTAPKEPMPCPTRQDPQWCHNPVSTGNRARSSVHPSATGPTAVPRSRHRREAALWRRSPQRLAQVPGHPGAGPNNWWGPAPRNCFQCFPVAQDSKRKTDLLHRERGLAPEGGPALPGEGTGATGRRDLRRKKGGPAPPGEGTCATRRRDLLLRGRTCGGRRRSRSSG